MQDQNPNNAHPMVDVFFEMVTKDDKQQVMMSNQVHGELGSSTKMFGGRAYVFDEDISYKDLQEALYDMFRYIYFHLDLFNIRLCGMEGVDTDLVDKAYAILDELNGGKL